jgi:hypothetical protein
MRSNNTISVAIILTAALNVPSYASEDLDLIRFRKITKQSTSTSCGAASAATWLQRRGLKTTESQILGSLADLWEAKRNLRLAILNTAKQVNIGDQAINRAVAALVRLQYPADAIKKMGELFLSGQHVPMGNNTGASRIDLEWAVNRTGISEKATWRGLDVKKLVTLQHQTELSGVVLLADDDHFVFLAGFTTDTDGIHAMIADPSSETGGNLLVPLSHFINKADPHGTGVIWLLTFGSTQQRPKAIFETFESRPFYLSIVEWEQRANNIYIHSTIEQNQQYFYMPIIPKIEAFVGVDQEMLLGIQGAIPIVSTAIVSSIAHLREQDGNGWSIGTQINDSSGNWSVSLERRTVFRDSSVVVSMDSLINNFESKSKESTTSFAFSSRINKSPVLIALTRSLTTSLPGAFAKNQFTMRFGDSVRPNTWETTTTITREASRDQKPTVGFEIHLSRRW